MRIRRIVAEQVWPFARLEVDFGEGGPALHVLYGPNEAGKSTFLRLLLDLLFGGPLEGDRHAHYSSESRLQGWLEHPGMPAVVVARRKRRQRLVLCDVDGARLTEEDVARYLCGYDRERFSLLFGFDHERLRAGGQSLLASGGEAGISLFEAGGGAQHLQHVLAHLRAKAEELLDPTFRARSAKRLNRAWRQYLEAVNGVRSQSLSAEQWQRLRRNVERLEEEADRLRQEWDQCRQALSQLERVRRFQGFVPEMRALRAQLGALTDVLPLPEELEQQCPEWLQQRRETLAQVEQLKLKRQRIRDELSRLQVDGAALGRADEVERLAEALELYITRRTQEIPDMRERLLQRKRDVVRQLRRLDPQAARVWEEGRADEPHSATSDAVVQLPDVGHLRLPLEDALQVRELADEERRWLQAEAVERSRLDDLASDLRQLEARLVEMGEPPDVQALRGLVADARAEGDLEAALRQKEAERARKELELLRLCAAQAVWSGPAEAADRLPVPLRETVDRYLAEWNALEQRLAELDRDCAKAEEHLRRVRDEWEQLADDGEKVVEWASVAAARARRDAGWSLVRQAWLAGGADAGAVAAFAGSRRLDEAFEAALREADDLADQLLKVTERTTRRALKQLERVQAERRLAELVQAREQATARRGELAARWREEWTACGVEPRSPAEMKQWLSDFHRPLAEGAKALRELRLECDRLSARIQDWTGRLAEAAARAAGWHAAAAALAPEEAAAQPAAPAPSPLPSGWGLKAWLSWCESFIAEADRLASDRRSLVSTRAEVQRRLREQQGRLKAVLGELARCQQRWDGMRRRYPRLPADLTAAVAFLDALDELCRDWEEFQYLVSAIESRKADCRTFEDRVGALAGSLAESVDTSNPAAVAGMVRRLQERVKSARSAFDQRQQRESDLAETEAELQAALARLAVCERELAALCRQAGVPSVEELVARVDQSRRLNQLQRQLAEKEQAALRAGDGLSMEALEAEFERLGDPDLLPLRLEEARQACDQREREWVAKRDELQAARQALQQWDGSQHAAARHAQEAEHHLAEVDRSWSEYVRVELARRMLQRAIEDFRERNESLVVRRASEWFRRLTTGRYEGIRVEHGDQGAYLEAVSSAGQRLRTHQLSDGTRDQLFLSLRLAFVARHLETSAPLPLILDDILVHFDDERTAAALEVLHELAGLTQVVCFTHHRAVLELAERLPSASRVRIHDLSSTVR
ncbi:MAG: AAA family ATPase [Alicyclobacillaceae bacterium]|nr:AAA family ATPase [Alicyclobacillaceae bacterium]